MKNRVSNLRDWHGCARVPVGGMFLCALNQLWEGCAAGFSRLWIQAEKIAYNVYIGLRSLLVKGKFIGLGQVCEKFSSEYLRDVSDENWMRSGEETRPCSRSQNAMNKKQINFSHRVRWMCGIGLCLVAATAWGGIVPPLYVGNLEPVLDQYGRTMVGSHDMAQSNSRSLVELRTSTKDFILPALTNGDAHPFNPLVSEEGIGGVGLNSSSPDSGLFCLVLADRPAASTKIFARVYNAPTAEEASFYADSTLVESPARGNSLVLSFSAAKAMDTNDVDGDGLNNSWEKALGIDDRLTSDYDGDGMSDLNEMLAGTAPDDNTSQLSFRLIQRDSAASVRDVQEGEDMDWEQPVRVRWQSVPGKTYQLEYVPMLIQLTGEDPIFVPVGEEIVAGDGEYEIEMLVDVPTDEDTGSFRIRLVIPKVEE